MQNHQKNLLRSHGFTIVEFMIASTLGLVVLAAVGSFYTYTRQLDDVAKVRLDMQQGLRSAATMITRDARQAGTFGCLTMGRIHNYDSEAKLGELNIGYAANTANRPSHQGGADFNALNLQNPKIGAGAGTTGWEADGSFGVRWLTNPTAELPPVIGFNYAEGSGALVFYYGMGLTGTTSITDNSSATAPVGVLNTITVIDNDPSHAVSNTAAAGGYLAVSSCKAMSIFRSNVNRDLTFKISDPVIRLTKFNNPDINVNEQKNSQIALSRYMVTAYVVGTVVGEPSSLYRFELTENGTWSAPELLVRNVSAMRAEFVYTTAMRTSSTGANIDRGCPSFWADEPNPDSYSFIRVSTAQPNNGLNEKFAVRRANDLPFPPALINLSLTYSYPQAGQVTTGSVGNHTFNITAAIRGGNTCADRQLTTNTNPIPRP